MDCYFAALKISASGPEGRSVENIVAVINQSSDLLVGLRFDSCGI